MAPVALASPLVLLVLLVPVVPALAFASLQGIK